MKVGIIDADIIDGGTRHPNLACMKMSSYYKSQGDSVVLLENYDHLDEYDLVLVARVFDFTNVPNSIYKPGVVVDPIHPEVGLKDNVKIGGTGFYFDHAPFLPNYIEHSMPDYHLYDDYVTKGMAEAIGVTNDPILKAKLEAKARERWLDYLDFSIGFTTRGCFRKCSFCVNKRWNRVIPWSPVKEFLDVTRPFIILWDDNFMAAPPQVFQSTLKDLIATGKRFTFRQGLDMRLMTADKAKQLSKVKYYGDFIFAFDHVEDSELMERNLGVWRTYCLKSTKLYVLTAYDSQDQVDIRNTFERIRILFTYGCLPYVMRYKSYLESPFKEFYIQIARWANQPALVKKMSFWEYCLRNQDWVVDHKGRHPDWMCPALRAAIWFRNKYPEIADKYFNMKFSELNQYHVH